jgi:hypothetical protein
VHRALGAFGPGRDDDAVDGPGDLAQALVAAVTLDLAGVRVDGADLIAPLSEALVDDVAAVVLGLAGDAGDGDSSTGQELRCSVFDAVASRASFSQRGDDRQRAPSGTPVRPRRRRMSRKIDMTMR